MIACNNPTNTYTYAQTLNCRRVCVAISFIASFITVLKKSITPYKEVMDPYANYFSN